MKREKINFFKQSLFTDLTKATEKEFLRYKPNNHIFNLKSDKLMLGNFSDSSLQIILKKIFHAYNICVLCTVSAIKAERQDSVFTTI